MGLGIFQGKRTSIGKRVLVPSGAPKKIGPSGRRSSGLARVEEYGTSQTITLVVGQNKGKADRNTSGQCARKPQSFSTQAIDRAFARVRGALVGDEKVAATRVQSAGWYEGGKEKSVAYEVAFIPPEGGGPPSEKSFDDFRRNMDRVAERLAEEFCQDSVLIVRDDGSKRSVAAAIWEKTKR